MKWSRLSITEINVLGEMSVKAETSSSFLVLLGIGLKQGLISFRQWRKQPGWKEKEEADPGKRRV